VAHRAEDLIGRLRDGELRPSASIVDICLESVDALKKFLYNQWPDEVTLQTSVKSLLTRIANLAPEEQEEGTAPAAVEEAPPPSMEDSCSRRTCTATRAGGSVARCGDTRRTGLRSAFDY
jgi:chemotaxis protein histidine kinase CheA